MKLAIGTSVNVQHVPGRQSSNTPRAPAIITSNIQQGSYHYTVVINGVYYYVYDYEIHPSTRKDLEAILGSLSEQIDDIQCKIAWMNENGSDNFDEQEYKLYHGLQIIESTRDTKEKVKALKELFNSFL